jgi:hypothetical protein
LPGLGSKIYTAIWANKSKTAHLTVTVTVYANPSVLKLAQHNLNQGLPGAPMKLKGVGSAAYQATGSGEAGIHFSVGKDVVLIILNTTGSMPKVSTALVSLASGVASKL